MEMATVKEIREIIESMLEQIEGWDDEDELVTSTSTYGLGTTILEVSDGFVDWSNLELDWYSSEDEEDD